MAIKISIGNRIMERQGEWFPFIPNNLCKDPIITKHRVNVFYHLQSPRERVLAVFLIIEPSWPQHRETREKHMKSASEGFLEGINEQIRHRRIPLSRLCEMHKGTL
ncbi:hypothetical protein XENTR_v10024708 [Xenopus tropicalis]|nr:hypothetical protein XENTR_v10024708 [Xenopus tropicalis]